MKAPDGGDAQTIVASSISRQAAATLHAEGRSQIEPKTDTVLRVVNLMLFSRQCIGFYRLRSKRVAEYNLCCAVNAQASRLCR